MSINTVSALPTETHGPCKDDDVCTDINQAICGVQEIKEKCCETCTSISGCQDELICKTYPSISKLCQASKEVRQQCRMSCGVCKDNHSK